MQWLIICSILAIVVCAAPVLIGKYFVDFALKRGDFDFTKVGQDFGSESESQPSEFDVQREQGLKWAQGLKPEKWTLRTDDGLNLVASFFKNEGSHKYVSVVHGYRGQKEDMFSFAKFFYEKGFNTLVADNRGHGESDGNIIGFGYLDAFDQKKWIEKIVEYDSSAEIALFGISMGGATVMTASGLDLPKNVKCIVEDCGYSSAWDEFSFVLKQSFHLPAFPVLNMSDFMCRKICKYSLKECSALNSLRRTKVPMMFIHGTADDFVPYYLLDKNLEAYAGPCKEVLRVEGVKHGAARPSNPMLYETKVLSFVEQFIK